LEAEEIYLRKPLHVALTRLGKGEQLLQQFLLLARQAGVEGANVLRE